MEQVEISLGLATSIVLAALLFYRHLIYFSGGPQSRANKLNLVIIPLLILFVLQLMLLVM